MGTPRLSSSSSSLYTAKATCLCLLLILLPLAVSAQPATLPFNDCFNGNVSQKMSVDTVYSQIVDGQRLNLTVLGQTAQEIIGDANTTNLATLFTQATTLTINTFSNNSYLCDFIRQPSSLANSSSNSTDCPIPQGPFALAVSIPFNPKNALTTLNTELRALDPFENEILCLTVATTALQPGPFDSPYGDAHSIFWATVGLAAAYWIIVCVARLVSAWKRGTSRPGSGIWARVESAGLILVSAISGERLATSPSLLRFCSPSLRDIMIHTQWCAALAMVAVQWPPFVYPLLSQTAWATLTYNTSLSDAAQWNPLQTQPYNPPSDFADQLSDSNSPLYVNPSISNTLFLLPNGTHNGMEAFAWSVGIGPRELFRTCLILFLAILAGTIILSVLVWSIDWVFSRKPISTLPTGATFSSSATKSRSPRQSGGTSGSKDMLDVTGDESRSLNAYGHSYPLFRRRWWLRSDLSSFHTSLLEGNLVRVLSLFHLPVTIFSAYQFVTVKTSAAIALAALSFAFFSVLLPGFLVLRLARTSTTKLYDETRTLLALGPLYNHFRPDSQMFSGLLFLSNLVNGLAIGCGQRSGTAQAIVILVSEVASALITSVWLPWGTGASMGLLSFLFCVARIVTAVLLVILTPTISIGAAASGWVAYGILVVLLLVYTAFTIILIVKLIEATVRIFGRVGFDRSGHAIDSGLVGVLGLLGCCGGGSNRRGRDRRQYRATEVRHSGGSYSVAVGDSTSLYAPPNASFARQAKSSAASHNSDGPPPSVLRPEHALQPYREDSDDDDESTHIMAAWQPFPSPESRLSYERKESTQSSAPQPSTSGFSRVGGGRAHYNSPYAIAGTSKGAGGSTLTFPSVEKRGSALGPSGGSSPRVATVTQDVEGEAAAPMTSVASVAKLPVLSNSGLPVGAMMPHMRTKSQTAIIIEELAGMANTSSAAQESLPIFELEEQERSAPPNSLSNASAGGSSEGGEQRQQQQQHTQPPRKKGWFNIRRNRRHSDGQILEDATAEAEEDSNASFAKQPETGRSFVVIRDKKPLSAQPHPNPLGRKPSHSLDESSAKPPTSFAVVRGSTSTDTQRSQ
ncbi:hypothetical protein F5J12DRAFT_790051 [Pisolithus orientalis]|uniref:uncharacterized protein n=1 Tax=Pisolithus orientalis TaxID=936130 RepID=UPI002224EF22|nr:uncharacterized protein F5J12DRAFT_790051 [Pisolithus orientalis]KAI6034955.1 hypothetical protein F5J12DRAFT_790051 [Pisolithus orientalis]